MIDCLIYCEILFFQTVYTFICELNKQKTKQLFFEFFYDIGVGSE